MRTDDCNMLPAVHVDETRGRKEMRLKDSHEHESEASSSLQHMAGINLMHVDVRAKATALRRQAVLMLANFSQALVS